MENERIIPYNFIAREYQVPFLREVNRAINGKSTVRNFMQIWHRRAGKDRTNIADIAPKRLMHGPCLVKYVYPTLVMGRDNLWDGIGSDGFRYRDHIPDFIRAGDPNESRMTIPIDNGSKTNSIFQIAGSDKPDSLRGGNPMMYIFSEWSEQNPYAWHVVEPIMRENGGITIFNLTPRGDNHARSLYDYALLKMKEKDPTWWVQVLTAEDTNVWSARQLEDIRLDIIKQFAADGRSEDEANSYFLQEYMCSFDTPVIGSYYGEAIRRADRENRITKVPWMENMPVETFWDLGMDDSMSIWFMQFVGLSYRFIDYYENSGEGFSHYAKVLQKKGYFYSRHFAPHDIAVRELGTGKSRLEAAASLGIKFEVAPMLSLEDGINATRSILRQCWFDADKCYRGINCLKNYRKDWDEKNKVFRTKPKHDWSSHGADSFRTFSTGYRHAVHRAQQTGWGGIKPYLPGIG